MAVTSITATTSAVRLCNYVLNGVAHDGSGDRRYVFASGIGCFAPAAAQAFAVTRAVRGQQGVVRQAYSVVQSFSRKEFDMDDPASAELVHELGVEFARRTFPGHQTLVVTQRDGKSGLLHNHIIVSNISDRDAVLVYRRKPRKNSFRDKLALVQQKNPDGLIEVREERPAGRAFSSAMGNRLRLAHLNDELLADDEFMQNLGLKAHDNKVLMATPPEKVTKDDHAKRDKGEYVWRDDLKLIISEEQRRAVSVDDFRDRLAARRVELRERSKEKHFSFGFIDAEGKSRQARALGVRGLGESFGRQSTVPMLEANQRATKKTVKLPVAPLKPVGSPQAVTGPQTPIAGSAPVHEDLEGPLTAGGHDTSLIVAVLEGSEIIADDHGEPTAAESGQEDFPTLKPRINYAAEPESAGHHMEDVPVVPATVPKRPAGAVRNLQHERTLALIEEQESSADERSL